MAKRFKITILIAVFFAVGWLWIFSQQAEENLSAAKKEAVLLGSEKLDVWVVKKPDERKRGLSGMEKLVEVDGMLFVFEEEKRHPFWMKDMHFPIDIIWISGERKVLEITYGVSPETYPDIFQPQQPVKYVIEVEAGRAEEINIEEGSVFSPNGRL